MTTLHERALVLAREIAADSWYPLRHEDDSIYARDRILSGDMDSTVQVQSALAAILRTTELAAEHCLTLDGALNNSGACSVALRNGAHLTKAPNHD